MGDFSGLQIGLSALYAQRRALEVTGQNLANVNTDGYSRQRVNLTADSGPIAPAIFSKYDGTGLGVRSGDVSRIRDQFLELRGYQEHATEADLQLRQQALAQVESYIGEPSDTGIAEQMADYWAGWDQVANLAGDDVQRTHLLEAAATLAGGFEEISSNLASFSASTSSQLSATVDEINSYAVQIADLNNRIQAATSSLQVPNDLLDQRDLLIGQVAERAGATVYEGEKGSMSVFIGGTALVRDNRAESLKLVVDPAGATSIHWTADNSTATVTGRTGGMLETVNDIVPRYKAQLDAVATQVLTATNAAHATGFDLNGAPGKPFFVATPGGGIHVNPLIAADGRLIAASSAPNDLNGSVARGIAASTGPDAAYRQLVVGLGVEAQSANRRVDIQGAITGAIDASRDSQSGVNLDEEMTNMITYQHAYNAAARYITAVDSMLETLINGTGRVGR